MTRDIINDKKFNLMVMYSHAASGMEEFFVGSNTEKKVRFSKAVVFTFRKLVIGSNPQPIVRHSPAL